MSIQLNKKGFLILTISKKHTLIINDNIEISLNKIKGTYEISLGIKAPKEIKVLLVKNRDNNSHEKLGTDESKP